jgi:hypothetical protein
VAGAVLVFLVVERESRATHSCGSKFHVASKPRRPVAAKLAATGSTKEALPGPYLCRLCREDRTELRSIEILFIFNLRNKNVWSVGQTLLPALPVPYLHKNPRDQTEVSVRESFWGSCRREKILCMVDANRRGQRVGTCPPRPGAKSPR